MSFALLLDSLLNNKRVDELLEGSFSFSEEDYQSVSMALDTRSYSFNREIKRVIESRFTRDAVAIFSGMSRESLFM